MNPAIIVVDMLRDNVYSQSHAGMGSQARELIPRIQELLNTARSKGMPVVFANDAFLPEDFIFRGTGIKPHSIMGTQGAQVISEFGPEPNDLVVEKRRFSAFWGTRLDSRLKDKGIDTLVVTGISTPVCVLTTALDGLAYAFHMIILEDCCAALRPSDHAAVVEVYRHCLKGPLFRIMKLEEFLVLVELQPFASD